MNEHAHRAPQDKVCGYEYTVRRGDSLYLIANRLGIPLRDLLEANSDINPARLMVGDVLCIPMEEDDKPQIPQTPSAPEEIPPEEVPETPIPDEADDLDKPALEENTPCPGQSAHIVRQGETATDVQLRHNVNLYTLQQANPTADLDNLAEGQVLCIPPANSACPGILTYTLQQEDTIESTALRLNTSLAALLRANPCLAPSDFTAGQRICIPQ
nr:LysM peptidoglycan-binding domain-containing protein [Clostridia bacterium]